MLEALRTFLEKDPIGMFFAPNPSSIVSTMGLMGGPDELFYLDLNLYTYSGNNPINFVDPLGLAWKKGMWIGVGIMGVGLLGVIEGALIALEPGAEVGGAVVALEGVAAMHEGFGLVILSSTIDDPYKPPGNSCRSK